MNSNSTSNKEIRKFGLVAFILFGCLCTLANWRDRTLPTYIFGFLSMLGIGFIVLPTPLRPIYATWLRIAHLIGRTVTMLTLTLAYYGLITPTALLKRLIGGHPLPLKPDKNASSYWVARTEPAQPKERFLKRY